MKTLSIRQPWADLIVRGIKDIENRSWTTTTYRGPLLIHARKTLEEGPARDRLYGPEHEWERGGVVGIADLINVVTDSESPWAHSDGETCHWVLANPRRAPFVPVNGKLNLFDTPWPSTTPASSAHRRDEQTVTPETLALANSRVPAVDGVFRSLSRARRLEFAERAKIASHQDDDALTAALVDVLRGSLHTVLHALDLDEVNRLLTMHGGVAATGIDDAVFELEGLIASPEDYEDEEDEDADADVDEDGPAASDVVDASVGEGAEATMSSVSSRTAPADVASIYVDEVMAAFRQAARGQGSMARLDLVRAVSRELGYVRRGSAIEDVLRGHLSAAVRRRVIEADGEQVRAATSSIDDYSLEELRDALVMGLRRGQRIERDEAIRQTVQGLGFRRVTDNVRQAFKSAFNSAIRQGLLESEGTAVVVRR